MSTGKILFRLYRRSKWMLGITVLLFLLPVGTIIFHIITAGLRDLSLIPTTVSICSYLQIAAMLFLSYEFFGKTDAAGLTECLNGTKGGALRLFRRQIGCMLALNGLLSVIYLCIYLGVCAFLMHLTQPAWLWNLTGSILFFFFLCPMTAVLLSAAASLCLKRLSAYLCFTLFVILNSPIKYSLEKRLSFRLSYPVPLSFLFAFYPQNLNSEPPAQDGFMLPETQILVVGCWLLFALLFLAFAIGLRDIHQRRRSISIAAICAVLLVGVTGYNTLPYSDTNADCQNSADKIYLDYWETPELAVAPTTPIEAFHITSCILNLNAKRYLQGEAVLTVEPDNLTVYGFTLHHDYTVQAVTDKNGHPMPFLRQGDFLTVENTAAADGFVITYSGANNTFYTKRRSLFLPGYFPYYPMAGYQSFFNEKEKQLAPCVQTEQIAFTVHLSSSCEVYSNLSETAPGVYEGMASAASFLGGKLAVRSIDGIELVYPYLSAFVQSPERAENAVKTMISLGLDRDTCERILLTPGHLLRGIQPQSILNLGDHLLTSDLNDVENDYQKSKILPYKVSLYESCYIYRTSPNTFESMASFAEDDSNAAYLLKIAIQEKGESAALAACETFLYNREDTRTIQAFFADFMREG